MYPDTRYAALILKEVSGDPLHKGLLRLPLTLAEIIRAKNIGDLLSLSSLLRILPQLGATELNYVRCAYAVGDPEEAERNVIDQCEANGVGFRIFRVSLTHGNQKHKNGPFDHI